MTITFARVGLLAVVVAVASLTPRLGRVHRSTAEDAEPFPYDSLVFADQWLAQVSAR